MHKTSETYQTGDLVKIFSEDEFPFVSGWIPEENDIRVHIFENVQILYGVYIKKSPCHNYRGWHEVFVENNIYIFSHRQLKFIQR